MYNFLKIEPFQLSIGLACFSYQPGRRCWYGIDLEHTACRHSVIDLSIFFRQSAPRLPNIELV
jgi:hypothetical protein